MIAYIKGQIDQIRADSVILEHNGMGYEVFVPASVLSQMPPRGRLKFIHTCMCGKIICVCTAF